MASTRPVTGQPPPRPWSESMNLPRVLGRFAHVPLVVTGLLTASLLGVGGAHAEESFTTFEAGQVRPLALSPDGKLLFATNTPDNRLEVFEVKTSSLVHRASIPVGLEPVAVAARS